MSDDNGKESEANSGIVGSAEDMKMMVYSTDVPTSGCTTIWAVPKVAGCVMFTFWSGVCSTVMSGIISCSSATT